MKTKIEFVGVIVKVNGKERTFFTDQLSWSGWAYDNEDLMESDSGVDLTIHDGRKHYKLEF